MEGNFFFCIQTVNEFGTKNETSLIKFKNLQLAICTGY
jgi:hypothetical protein